MKKSLLWLVVMLLTVSMIATFSLGFVVKPAGKPDREPPSVVKPAGKPDRVPPSVPQDVAVNALDAYNAQVTWSSSTDNVGVTGYKVFRNGVQIGTSATTTYTDNTAVPLSSYTFTVAAYDAAGNVSDQSSGANITMPEDSSDTVPPSQPTNVTAEALCSDYVLLNWTASTDNIMVVGYKIYKNSILVATVENNSFLDSTTVKNTNYSYYIVAYDVGNNDSDPSDTVNVTTPSYSRRNIALTKTYDSSMAADGSYPDTNNQELTDGLYGAGDYSDSNWQGRLLSNGYYTQTVDLGQICSIVELNVGFCNNTTGGVYLPTSVEFSISENGSDFVVIGLGLQQAPIGDNTKFNLTLANTASARYVRAKVSGNGWIFTDEFEIWGPPPPGSDIEPPSVPSNLTATANVSTWVKLTWTASTDNVGVEGYNIYRDGVKISTSSSNSFRDTTTGLGITYTYQVSAFDAEGNESDLSNSANYTTPSDAEAAKILQGSFFQPSLSDGWGASGFATEYDYMKDVYMDHIIWQWTADSKNMLTWYPTNLPGFTQHSTYDAVGVSLEQAQQKGIKVWLGLNWTDDWWNKYANDEAWLTNEFNLSKQIAQELWDLYGLAYGDTIAGFYMTMEVDNVNFQTTVTKDRMKNVYKDVADYIHANMNKPVMVAPFFNEYYGGDHQGVTEYADMWEYILTTAPIDIVAVQDGIGVDHCSVETIGTWLSALKDAIAAVRPSTQLWSDLETLDSDFTPALISRVIDQINAEAPYVVKFTSFSFNHYDSPQQGHTSEYNDYKAYVDQYMLSTQ